MATTRREILEQKCQLTTLEAAMWFGYDPDTGTGGYSPATLRTWRLRGGGPAYDQPRGQRGKVFYTPANLKAWERRNKTRKRTA